MHEYLYTYPARDALTTTCPSWQCAMPTASWAAKFRKEWTARSGLTNFTKSGQRASKQARHTRIELLQRGSMLHFPTANSFKNEAIIATRKRNALFSSSSTLNLPPQVKHNNVGNLNNFGMGFLTRILRGFCTPPLNVKNTRVQNTP